MLRYIWASNTHLWYHYIVVTSSQWHLWYFFSFSYTFPQQFTCIHIHCLLQQQWIKKGMEKGITEMLYAGVLHPARQIESVMRKGVKRHRAGFGWGNFLPRSWCGAVFGSVLVTLGRCRYCWAALAQRWGLFCSSAHPTSERAGGARGAGRGHSRDSWPQLTQGTSHAAGCWAQHIKLGEGGDVWSNGVCNR